MTQTPLPSDTTPFIESRALKKKLQGVRATASNYPTGQEVPVTWVGPDFEIRSASYPGIYLSYAGVHRATDREHRGRTHLPYAPPGFPTDVLVPVDVEDKENTDTEPWSETFDVQTSPYMVEEYPIPYNLDFNVTVLTRNYDQAFQIIWALQDIQRIPERFGHLEVPEDGTIRTLDLLGGPETSTMRDEDGKRVVQTIYSVRVTAELNLYEVQQVQRVVEVALDLHRTDELYL